MVAGVIVPESEHRHSGPYKHYHRFRILPQVKVARVMSMKTNN